jgi:hypothetical protein
MLCYAMHDAYHPQVSFNLVSLVTRYVLSPTPGRGWKEGEQEAYTMACIEPASGFGDWAGRAVCIRQFFANSAGSSFQPVSNV